LSVPEIIPAPDMTTDELVALLTRANEAYRTGNPIIDDDTFDHIYLAELKKREPEHPYLDQVQPDTVGAGSSKIRHTEPMLSTDKAYNQEEVTAFVVRVQKAADAQEIPSADIRFRITPKLDGMAARYSDGILATRGNGQLGNDITRNIKRGLVMLEGEKAGVRENTGVGEIVIPEQYFNDVLADSFSHPRNFVTGLIGADNLSEEAKEAMQDGAVQFVPYSGLKASECDVEDLLADAEGLCEKIEKACIYPLDGSVIDVLNLELRIEMGATNHHHNWQIAKKSKGVTAVAEIEGITWRTGRTRRITPVLNVKTINLSGADISNVTGHNAGNVKNLNVGVGAHIEIVRSGEVIPKLLGVVKPGKDADIPDLCPACKAPAKMEKDFLVCQGETCVAQIEAQLQHFFNTLGNIDLFGPSTINTLVENDIRDLAAIYKLQASDFEGMGFGPKQSTNLVAQLERSRSEEVEDWRLLAAFGIHHLGKGDAKKLLAVYKLEALDQLTSEQLIEIPGFGEITAESIPKSIALHWLAMKTIIDLGFNLRKEEKFDVTESVITDQFIVFTGAMQSSRDDMKAAAQRLGANVQSAVNKKTNYLVIGEKVGAKKIEKAESLGTKVVTEAEYLVMIGAES